MLSDRAIKALNKSGVTRNPAAILMMLLTPDGEGTSFGSLAERMELSLAHTSTAVSALVTKGLAEKASPFDDLRRATVYLTVAGRKRADSMVAAVFAAQN